MASQPIVAEVPRPLDPQPIAGATLSLDPATTIKVSPQTIPDPTSLIFRLLTPAEKEASWLANSVSWAARLSVPDYVNREAINGNSSLLRDGGVRYWGLASQEVGGEIYATVETLKKKVLVATNEGFDIEDSYGIASVFTPAKYRGHGMAGAMMQKLGEWLDTEEANCRFSVLFSDVGSFYVKHGWSVFPSPEIALPASTTPTLTLSLPQTTPITADTLQPYTQSDLLALTVHLMKTPIPTGTHARLAFIPSIVQADWHFGAEEFSASKLYPDRAPPTVKGASVGTTFGYWVRDYNERKLIMLRLSAAGPWEEGDKQGVLEIAAVIKAALDEAQKADLGKVVLWYPDEKTKEACALISGAEVEVRTRTEGSVPCLRWNGKQAGGKGVKEEGVDWIALEKYCWC